MIFGLGPVASSPARAARVASDVRRAAGEPKPAVAARANLALLAARVAAARSNSGSGSGSSASSGSATGTASQPATSPATQFLIPANVADPIMNSKLIKDLERLISIRHGKMPNFNQQTLDALQADVGLRSPRNVAPHPARSGAKSRPAAAGA